jgi:alpha-methylacyl-CoA racemase
VVDAAMVDGSALLTSFLHGLLAAGMWSAPRGSNLLDGGAPFYDTYTTSDGLLVAVGALEPPFFRALLDGLELSDADLPAQYDEAGWPLLRKAFTARFRTRTRDEWTAVFAGRDACVTPVLSPGEAPTHPHNRSRGTFVAVDGLLQPAPAPRFARTPLPAPAPPQAVTVEAVLDEWAS